MGKPKEKTYKETKHGITYTVTELPMTKGLKDYWATVKKYEDSLLPEKKQHTEKLKKSKNSDII